MAKPLILITNDDGIYSPGLLAAAEAAAPLGELLIVAPRTQQTSMGRSAMIGPDIGIIEEVMLTVAGEQIRAYAVHGTPALAAAHGILELASRKPSLCVSGINYGENLGAGMTMSGTVGAALEASSLGVPALATSIELDSAVAHSHEYVTLDWSMAIHFTHLAAKRILEQGLPATVAVVNLNTPAGATTQTEVRTTHQSRQLYYEWVVPTQPRDFNAAFRLGKSILITQDTVLDADSDIAAFARDHVVSLTPLTWDLTARVDLAKWSAEFTL